MKDIIQSSPSLRSRSLILAGLVTTLVIAVVASAGFCWKRSYRGEVIRIHVRDINGMIPGKTGLSYRGVLVGMTESIDDGIVVVRIDPRYGGLLHSDSRILVSRWSLPEHDLAKSLLDSASRSKRPEQDLSKTPVDVFGSPVLTLESGSSPDLSTREFVALDPPPPSSDPSHPTFLGHEIDLSQITTSPPLPR